MKYKQLTNNTKSLKTKNPLDLSGLCGASIAVPKLLENELVFVVYFEVETFWRLCNSYRCCAMFFMELFRQIFYLTQLRFLDLHQDLCEVFLILQALF